MNKIGELLKGYINGDELEISFVLPPSTDIIGFAKYIGNRFPESLSKKKIKKYSTKTYPENKRARLNIDKKTTTFMIKKRKGIPVTFDDGIKLKLASEIKTEPFSENEMKNLLLERIMQRIKFPINNQWVIDLSIVKTYSDDIIIETSKELEVEYKGVTPPSVEKINDTVNMVRSLLIGFGIELNIDFDSKLKYVYSVYRGNDENSEYTKSNPTIKGINPVFTLKPHTWRELLSDPTNIVITDKIDGVRKIIYSDGNFIYILNNNTDFIYYNYSTGIEFIFDAEEYTNKDGIITYYIFDVYKYKYKKFYKKNFTTKLDTINTSYKIISEMKNIPIRLAIKPFHELKGDYRKMIDKFINEEKPYETDGFIIINNKENISYKYKKDNTIDFYLKKLNDKDKTYILYCTIDNFSFKNLSLPKVLIEEEYKNSKVFPIPFISSLDTSREVSIAKIEEEGDHEGKIGEFTRKNGKWELLKFRTDRIVTSKYYGNFYKVAESNFIMGMINFDIVSSTSYFNVSNNKTQKNVRHYTNLVMKKNLFNKIYGIENGKNTDTSNYKLLDVSCGKGQDLNRYGRLEVVLGLDYDKNAIIEMIDRKLDEKKQSSLLLTCITDVTIPAQDNFSLIKEKHNIENGFFTHAVCLLAFHYYCDDATKLNNALEFISGCMQDNAKLGIILFNGEKILDIMGKSKITTKFPFGSEMCLRKDYNVYEKFGTKIGVKLPFSGNEFYEENVVVIDELLSYFQSHNLFLEEIIPFDKYFDDEKYPITDINDKNYLGLYQAVVFVKKNKK